MRNFRIIMVLMLVGILAAGCSQEADLTAPDTQTGYDKDGSEELGMPSIAIADGSGFVEGGVGMVDTDTGNFDVTVPMGATVMQVLLYWEGGTTGLDGDDTISVNGNSVTGTEIGGPTNFFDNYDFYAYRADITADGWVVPGLNSFEITDFDFDFSGNTLDENNGAGILVIYDDGTLADLSLFDGLDLAYFNFAGDLNHTGPKTFTFNAEVDPRVADLVVFAGSVGVNRPNQIKVTTIAGDQIFDNVLGSSEGLLWDSHVIQVDVPAGATELTVELISVDSMTPRGASMAWIGTGLSVPVTPLACIGDYVWFDVNENGIQDDDEQGAHGVEVWLQDCQGGTLDIMLTDADGYYMFCDLVPGDYNIHFELPLNYVFSPMNMGTDPAIDSDADPATGTAVCTTLDPGEHDMTWDAGIYMPQEEGCTLTLGFWKNHAGFGPQDDVLSQYLPITLGDAGGTKSLDVTSAAIAVDVLEQKTYGKPNNGITKLYCQLLVAKLNFASGASDSAVADYVTDADAFLADHDYMDWNGLSEEDVDNVMMWHKDFDDYNNGDIGPGHCEDVDDDTMEMFK
jgi:hypothetical protein